jgi:hypothetical protein
VAEDFRDGLITRGAAREHYGVVLDDDGALDVAATEKIRAR